MGIADYSTNPSLNQSLPGMTLAEGQLPNTLNDAIRQVCADIATGVAPNMAAITAATDAATVSTIMKRDAAGRAKVAAPSASTDIAQKAQVDAVSAILGTPANVATANSIVKRDGNGNAYFAPPVAAGHAATKDYVDTATVAKAYTDTQINGLLYTGSNVNNLTFPIGSCLVVSGGGDRNDSFTVYLSSNTQFFTTSGPGSGTLTGTWRCRGAISGAGAYLMQRTA